MRLYVGQSTEMRSRINNHQNADYRKRNPSLHYYIVDTEGVNNEFVFLCGFTETEVPSIKLNLLEMWCCLILQTLQENSLRTYLPESAIRPGGGRHLNVALPLYQNAGQEESDKATLGNLIFHTHDRTVQAHMQEMRNSYHQLKNSSDQRYREYYQKTQASRLEKWDIKQMEKNLRYLDGRYLKVSSSRRNPVVIFFLTHTLPRRIFGQVQENSQVWAKFDIVPSGAHPKCFALNSLEGEPAARLGLFVRGLNTNDEIFQGWYQTKGQSYVRQANSVVDRLEGSSWKEIVKRPRRYIRPMFRKRFPHLLPKWGLIRNTYTPDEMPADEGESLKPLTQVERLLKEVQ